MSASMMIRDELGTAVYIFAMREIDLAIGETPEEWLVRKFESIGKHLPISNVITPHPSNFKLYEFAYKEFDRFMMKQGVRVKVVAAESGTVECQKVTNGEKQTRVVRLVR